MSIYAERIVERTAADLWISLGQRMSLRLNELERDSLTPSAKFEGFGLALDLYHSLSEQATMAGDDDDRFFHSLLDQLLTARKAVTVEDFMSHPGHFDQGLRLAMDQVTAVGM